jgi:hypothetical protein
VKTYWEVANDQGNSGILDLRNLCWLHHRGAHRWRCSVSALNRAGQPRMVNGLRSRSALEAFERAERRRERQRYTIALCVALIVGAVIIRMGA